VVVTTTHHCSTDFVKQVAGLNFFFFVFPMWKILCVLLGEHTLPIKQFYFCSLLTGSNLFWLLHVRATCFELQCALNWLG
jgi:hypothetical protein